MVYTLIRISESPDGTFGSLRDETSKPLCVTCEPTLNDPHPCIPEGTYHCIPHNGPEWQNVWEVTNVAGRAAILIHAGNTDLDTKGCVVVGAYFGSVSGCVAVMKSVKTLNTLRQVLPQEFDLTIVNSFPVDTAAGG